MLQNTFFFLGSLVFFVTLFERTMLAYMSFLKLRKYTKGGLTNVALIRDFKAALIGKTALINSAETREKVRKAVNEATDLPRLERINERLDNLLNQQPKEAVNA